MSAHLEIVSEKIIEAFKKVDVNGTGNISSDNLIRVLLRLNPDVRRLDLISFLTSLGFQDDGFVPYRLFISSLFRRADYEEETCCSHSAYRPSEQLAQHTIHHKCGDVFVHGSGDCDQLGLGNACRERRKPTRLHSLVGVRIVSIACGGLHSICTSADGRLYSWGCGDDGALGRPSIGDDCEPRLVELPAGVRSRIVACGDSHSASVDWQGHVWTWGSYKDGSGYMGVALSHDQTVDRRWMPSKAPGSADVVGLASGSNHTIALRSTGKAFAWGSNQSGQLGLESRRGCEFAVEELKGQDVSCLTFFDREGGGVMAWRPEFPDVIHHVMAISSSYGTEMNAQGMTASDIQSYSSRDASIRTLANRTVPLEEKVSLMFPQAVELGSEIGNVYASSEGTFVTTKDGTCHGCGLNSNGQVGIGYVSPVVFHLQAIKELNGASWIGGGVHMSAALVNCCVFTWGRAEECGLGMKATSPPVLTPSIVSFLPPIHSLRCGMSHTLACCEHGQVYAWGCGVTHQLGNCPRHYRDQWKNDREPNDELVPYAISSKRFDGRIVLMADGGAQHTVELVWDEGHSKLRDPDSDSAESIANCSNAAHDCGDVLEYGCSSNDVIVVTTREEFWRVQIEAVYRRRNPHKMEHVPALLKKYEGCEAVLYTKVCKRYDLDPTKFYANPEAWADEDHDIKPDADDSADVIASTQPSMTFPLDWNYNSHAEAQDVDIAFQSCFSQTYSKNLEPTLFQFGSSSEAVSMTISKIEDNAESSDEEGKPLDRPKAKRKKPRVLQNTTFMKSKRKQRSS